MRIRKPKAPCPDADDDVSLDIHVNGVKIKANGASVYKIISLVLGILVGYEFLY